MTRRSIALTLIGMMTLVVHASLAIADDRPGKRWWRGEWDDGFWSGEPCAVKVESKRGEFKREIKCPNGVGATWRGQWKTEYRDGPCLVKQEAKRDEFKEEVKCERG
jgi:hypothetical protein